MNSKFITREDLQVVLTFRPNLFKFIEIKQSNSKLKQWFRQLFYNNQVVPGYLVCPNCRKLFKFVSTRNSYSTLTRHAARCRKLALQELKRTSSKASSSLDRIACIQSR